MKRRPNPRRWLAIAAAAALCSLPLIAEAQPEPVIPPTEIDLPEIGRLAPRHARDIASSDWSIGCEVLDRDMADYQKFKAHLGPLGAKHARLQAGWAKTERSRGRYDWAWLDVIVDDMRAQGVQPWLQLSYGNPLYPGGGGPTLGDGLPQSEEALAAWDAWVRGTVRHFRERVWEWEVWNEPDGSKLVTAEQYTAFFVRTAAIIRQEQPRSRIYALTLGRDVAYAEKFLRAMKARGLLGLFDAITYHGYPMNPDETRLEGLRAMIARLGLDVPLRQGETGAPSTTGSSGALGKFPGSELAQAKWDLRRMLAFRGEDVPFNLFLLMEFDYAGKPHTGMNTKGLLKAAPDGSVLYPKAAYRAMQHVCAVFDDRLERVRGWTCAAGTTDKVSAHAYRARDGGGWLFAYWASGAVPSESTKAAFVDFTLPGVSFREPVVADLRTGRVYAFPAERIERTPEGLRLRQVPLYDSPIVVAEKALLPLR